MQIQIVNKPMNDMDFRGFSRFVCLKDFLRKMRYFFVEKKHRKYLGTPFTNLTHLLCIQIQAIFTHVFVSRHLHYISFLYIKIESVTGLNSWLFFFHPLKKFFTSFVMWKSFYRNLVHFRVYIFLLIFLTILRTFRFG